MIALSDYYQVYMLDALYQSMKPSTKLRSQGMIYDESGQFSAGQRHLSPARQQALDEVIKWHTVVTQNLATAVRDYLFLACMGEMRHLPGGTPYKVAEIQHGGDREAVYAVGYKHDPQQGFPVLIAGFAQKGWGSGFGGKNWGVCAEAGSRYWDLSPYMYIDHCADLQHNNGYVYSKTRTANYTKFEIDAGQTALHQFLDWKLKSNILLTPPASMQSSWKFQPYVARLIDTYYHIWLRQDVPDWLRKMYTADYRAPVYTSLEYLGQPLTLIVRATGKPVDAQDAAVQQTVATIKPKPVAEGALYDIYKHKTKHIPR